MAKVKDIFVCRACGSAHSRWIGKCPDCGGWGTLEQERFDASAAKDPQRGIIESWQAQREDEHEGSKGEIAGWSASAAMPIVEIKPDEQGRGGEKQRVSTGISELDRVLGGGLVPGSVVLVGGDPGIGKSTLMLQMAGRIGNGESGGAGAGSLYVSSEESAEQVRMRAARLGVASSAGMYVLSDTNLARIVEQVRKVLPRVVVIDSVQMIYKSDLPASPGSITQLRRCCAELVYLAKVSGISVVLVGHVTKDGQLAGPRLLEHLVDAVLYFEGDRYHAHRVLRSVKNRFGTTLEIGIFEMTGSGLKESPGGLSPALTDTLMGNTGNGKGKIGSAICPVMTGTRCMMVEVQALTATGFLGSAKRKSSGLDANRLAMLIAVLEQHAELRLADRDIFASSVGGLRVVEPAADLGLLLAIAGAHFRRSLAARSCVVGEVGLGGEVRGVTQIETRASEAARLGFTRVIVPMQQIKAAKGALRGVARNSEMNAEIVGVATIGQAIAELG